MISSLTSLFLGSVTGLHVACYGAYKDSPHERFKLLRFIREIILATIIAATTWKIFPEYRLLPAFLFFLFVLAWSRIVTEAYKLFVRTEPQNGLLAGMATAVGGGYKDGLFEGLSTLSRLIQSIIKSASYLFCRIYLPGLSFCYWCILKFDESGFSYGRGGVHRVAFV